MTATLIERETESSSSTDCRTASSQVLQIETLLTDDEDVGDFIARQVLEKDAVFFEG
jgi:hypothetical protein